MVKNKTIKRDYSGFYTLCSCGNKKRIGSKKCQKCYYGPGRHKHITTPSYIRINVLEMKGGKYGTKTNTC